jgi:16S rRNA (adenine1518-N6/adenine1519-N6)-dimethyltransferase
MVLMFQREVARRVVAVPGKKDYGSLSLSVQYQAAVRMPLRVSRKSFYPNPKVESAVVTLQPHPSPPICLANEDLFFKMIRSVFQHRRKSIKNALKEGGFEEPAVSDALLKSHLDPLRRPETLTLSEFGLLTDHLFFSLKKL